MQKYNKPRTPQEGERGFLLAFARTPMTNKPFTAPNKIIMVFPDLHMHLYVGQAVDRFVYVAPTGVSSLDTELRSLIDLAKKTDAETIQVGNMYEIWESEMLLRYQYAGLLDDRVSKWVRIERKSPDALRSDWKYMLKRGCIIPIRLKKEWHEIPTEPVRDDGEVEEKAVYFWKTDSIKKAIRRARHKLFKGSDRLFDHELAGNHDNEIENCYWSQKYAPEMYGLNEKEKTWLGNKDFIHTNTLKGKNELRCLKLGRSECIWVEHGHAYDVDNADEMFWKEGKGFRWTKYNIDLILVSLSITSYGTGEEQRSIADWATDMSNKEMRLYLLHRADQILQNEKDISLVVMGHTHSACIRQGSRGNPFLIMHPHSLDYLLAKDRLGPKIV